MIELKNISFWYHEQEPLFQGLNWKFPNCRSLSIMGRSGEGKTSLLNMIGTLISPIKGEIFLNKKKIDFNDKNKLATIRNHNISFIFQHHELLPQLTVLENILLPLNPRGESLKKAIPQAMDLLKKVGMEGKKERRPAELSGGESQRVAVVRALIPSPDLILMDEPTGSLDKTNADRLLQLFNDIQDQFGSKIILVTHDESVAKEMDQQFHLDQGQLIPD